MSKVEIHPGPLDGKVRECRSQCEQYESDWCKLAQCFANPSANEVCPPWTAAVVEHMQRVPEEIFIDFLEEACDWEMDAWLARRDELMGDGPVEVTP